MPLDTFIYERPLLIDLPKGALEQVTADDLKPYHEQLAQADLLMIRSGFSIERERNPQLYSQQGPSISADACKHLMDHYRGLKAVAMDWISLACQMYKEDGLLAHQYLLGVFHDHYICIIEDVHFSGIDTERLHKVWAMPLFVERIDSAPVTVMAELID
jgi:kynurenine formamidase